MSEPLPLLSLSELEDWIIEKGDVVIQRRALLPGAITPEEDLVHCLWCVDYGMRNAGDLSPAIDLKPDVLEEGQRLSSVLQLPKCSNFFAQKQTKIEQSYFDQFEMVCSELEAAYQAMLERHS